MTGPPRPLHRVRAVCGLLSICVAALAAGGLCAGEIPPPPVGPGARPDPPADATASADAEGGRGCLLLEVTDGEQALPARVRVTAPDGRSLLPGPDDRGLAVDGGGGWELPAGLCTLTVSAGPRRTVRRLALEIPADATLRQVVTLEPFFPLAPIDWIAFDPWRPPVPGDGAARARQRLVAAADGIDLFGSAVRDGTGAGSGVTEGPHRPAVVPCRVAVGRGIAWALGLPPARTPPRTPYRGRGGPPPLHPYLALWRAQGGFVVWRHTDGGEATPGTGMAAAHAGADLVFATVAGPLYDAMDIGGGGDALRLWIYLLQRGHRIAPLAGGPGGGGGPPALAYLPRPSEMSPAALAVRLREGELVAGTGPLLRVRIGGAPPGGVLRAGTRRYNVAIDAYSSSAHQDAIDVVEVLHNGRAVKRYAAGPGEQRLRIEDTLEFAEPGWCVVACRGTDPARFAVASPLWLDAPGAPRPPAPAVVRLRVRAERGATAAAARVEIWNAGALLGRHAVPAAGRTFPVPATATAILLDAAGHPVMARTVYEASGAAEYTDRLAALPPDELRARLLDDETYARMRFLLREVTMVFPVENGDGAAE
ncbi:MAG: hypothetical protein ACOCX4_04640 [Planctomycetota bacterium]